VLTTPAYNVNVPAAAGAVSAHGAGSSQWWVLRYVRWQNRQGGSSIDWSEWAPLIWFAALLFCLVLMKRWLSTHLYGLGLLLSDSHDVAILLYFLLLLPGVLVHELSHWVAAKLLRVPVSKITLGPSLKGDGVTRLGSVSLARTDPLRGSLIGLAPLVTGSLLVLVIGYSVFGLSAPGELAAGLSLENIPSALRGYFSVPNFFLWVYLIFSISNAMLPSESDRQAWVSLVLYFCVAVVVLYGFGLLEQVSSPLYGLLVAGLSHLSLAFLLTVAVDAAVIALVVIVERVVMTVRGKRVEY
jgi:hypothetical protein